MNPSRYAVGCMPESTTPAAAAPGFTLREVRAALNTPASQVLLAPGSVPRARIGGDLRSAADRPITKGEVAAILGELLTPAQFREFEAECDVEASLVVAEVGDCTVHVSRAKGLSIVTIRRGVPEADPPANRVRGIVDRIARLVAGDAPPPPPPLSLPEEVVQTLEDFNYYWILTRETPEPAAAPFPPSRRDEPDPEGEAGVFALLPRCPPGRPRPALKAAKEIPREDPRREGRC